jgi:hypothetical protein
VNTLQAPHHDLALAYEALRAHATGALTAVSPRGLALFLVAGFPDWMEACAPLAPAASNMIPDTTRDRELPIGHGGEVVQLLAEMALGCHRRWTS